MPEERLKTSGFTKQVMQDYYDECRLAPAHKQVVAWCTAGAPAEILRAAGIVPVFPENHSAACGTKRLGPMLSELAESAGLSHEVCSYVRCDLGVRLGGPSPWGGLPKPDILLCGNQSCQTVTKWYEDLARYFGARLFLLDMPYNFSGEITNHSIEYMVKQLKELIGFLEQVTGNPFDMEKLKHIVEISQQTVEFWNKCLEMGTQSPSPITTTDLLINMGPIVCLRGTDTGLEVYQQLYEEIRTRAQTGYAAVKNERFRLIWDNIPLWYALGSLIRKLAQRGGVLVGATYLYHWRYDLDPNDLLRSIARSFSTSATLNMSLQHKINKVSNIFREYGADGMIIHSNRSCKTDTVGSFDLARAIRSQFGKPVLVIEADHTDSRAYAEAGIDTRIEAFFESLEQTK